MKGFLKIAGLLGVFGGLFLLERCWPLRPEKESKARRNAGPFGLKRSLKRAETGEI